MEIEKMTELNELEIEQISGGIPVLAVAAGAIFLAGVAVGAYNAYKELSVKK